MMAEMDAFYAKLHGPHREEKPKERHIEKITEKEEEEEKPKHHVKKKIIEVDLEEESEEEPPVLPEKGDEKRAPGTQKTLFDGFRDR